MSKYIIDIPKTVGMTEKVGSVHYTYFDGIQCQTIILKSDEIEELNSDYINEHFSDLQDTAYQQGLEDAWEAARKIVDMWDRIDNDELLAIFGITERIGYSTIITLFGKQTASEAIEKLKAYEQKQNDKIEVGNEVKWNSDVIVVTRLYKDGEHDWCDGIGKDGRAFHVLAENVRKTGKHIDIASILEGMRND